MSVCVTFEIQWCEKTAMASYLITSLLVHGFVNTHFQTWRALSSEKQELREKNKRLIEPIKCFFVFFPKPEFICTDKMNQTKCDTMSLVIFQW